MWICEKFVEAQIKSSMLVRDRMIWALIRKIFTMNCNISIKFKSYVFSVKIKLMETARELTKYFENPKRPRI